MKRFESDDGGAAVEVKLEVQDYAPQLIMKGTLSSDARSYEQEISIFPSAVARYTLPICLSMQNPGTTQTANANAPYHGCIYN